MPARIPRQAGSDQHLGLHPSRQEHKMVKFKKQLAQQLVPEWTDAYCNYKLLKQQMKRIKQHHHQGTKAPLVGRAALHLALEHHSDGGDVETGSTNSSADLPQHQVKRISGSPLAAFPGLARRTGHTFKPSASIPSIKVHQRQSDTHGGEYYETEILEPCIAAAEHEKIFFKMLDEQLNIVDRFYRRKEGEFIIRAHQLETQMRTLVEMQKTRSGGPIRVSHLSPFDSDVESTDDFDPHLQILASAGKGYSEEAKIMGIDEKSKLKHFSLNLLAVSNRELQSNPGGQTGLTLQANPEYDLQRKDHVCYPVGDEKLGCTYQHCSFAGSNIQLTSSVSPAMVVNIPLQGQSLEAISALSRMLWEEMAGTTKKRQAMEENKGYSHEGKEEFHRTISKKKVQGAQKMLRAAFTEFYRGLTLLASFSSLNMQAFEKILKKYDKVTGRHTSDTYLRAIETSYFAGSDKVVKLMEMVEGIFTEHFTKKNERQAMAYLKPTKQKASHSITFLSGVFSGCSLALFLVYLVLLKGYHFKDDTAVFPIFSILALILLHLYLYCGNVYLWQRVRINYAFIFEFAPGTELRSREVLLLSTVLTTVLTLGMISHLVTNSRRETFLGIKSVSIPLIVTMVFLILLFLPLNLLYKSSRIVFLKCLTRVMLAPLYKVVLVDFFIADQITSQVTGLRNLEYAACYCMASIHGTNSTDISMHCTGSNLFWSFKYIVSMLPYWWRIMQCLRRWIDEDRDPAHVANLGKYLSAMVAVVMRVTYTRNHSAVWQSLFITSSVIATIYQIYWDIVVDWGLLRKNSANPWLRDQLILKRKYLYFISMALNFVLRLAWVYTLIHTPQNGLTNNLTDFTFAALEVIRRGQWNFYRLENEHLNNVGKFRAVNQVPLPFNDSVRHRL